MLKHGYGILQFALYILALCAFAAGAYFFAYANPIPFNSDSLMYEHMYQDLILGTGSYWDWSLPNHSGYIDMLLHGAARFLGGDMYRGMALFAVFQAGLTALGSAYLVNSITQNKMVQWLQSIAALLLVLYAFTAGNMFTVFMEPAHVGAMGVTLLVLGMFMRVLQGELANTRSYPLCAGLAAGTWLLTASDPLGLVWFVLPACGWLTLLCWKKQMSVRQVVLYGLLLLLAAAAGRFTDRLLVPNVHGMSMVQVNAIAAIDHLGTIARQYGVVLLQPGGWLLGVGTVGLFMGLAYNATRHFAAFLLWTMGCVALGVSLNGYSFDRYVFPVFFLPAFAGTLLLMHIAFTRTVPVAKVQALGSVVGLGALLALAGQTYVLHAHVNQPYYPQAAQCLDAISQQYNVHTGISGYWEARKLGMLSRTNVQLASVAGYGAMPLFPWVTTRNTYRDRYDMIVLNSTPGAYYRLDKDYLTAINGEPDLVLNCADLGFDAPELGDILIYKHGARHATWADALLDGQRLLPEMAGSDRTIWTGSAPLGTGMTLLEVRTAQRWKKNLWGVLIFAEKRETLLGQTVQFEIIGDRSPSHRRKITSHITHEANGLLDKVLRLFMLRRSYVLTPENTTTLPDGTTALFVKMPERDSKNWLGLLVGTQGHITRLF